MSDGDWTLEVQNTMVEGGITITQKYKFDVTVADGNSTFTSGTLTIEMPTDEILSGVTTYDSLDENTKQVYINKMAEGFNGFGTLDSTKSSFTSEKLTIVFNINSSMLSSASNSMSFSNIPGDAVITSNEAKTSYTIAINEDGVTVYYIITKQDKK